jgi:hypothetical protein
VVTSTPKGRMLNMSQNSSRQTAEDLIQQVQKYEWARTGSGRAGCSRDDLDCEAHGFNGPRVAEQPLQRAENVASAPKTRPAIAIAMRISGPRLRQCNPAVLIGTYKCPNLFLEARVMGKRYPPCPPIQSNAVSARCGALNWQKGPRTSK